MTNILTSERQTFLFRLLAVLGVGIAFFVAGSGVGAASVVSLLILYLLYAFGLHALLPRWPRRWLVYPMMIVDAVFLGLLLYVSGGAGYFVIVLLPLMVPFYAVYGGYPLAFAAASLSLATLLVVQSAQGKVITGYVLMSQIPLFYLLAALSGYLAQGRIRRQEEQDALQRLIRLENEAYSLSGAVRTIREASDLVAMLQDVVDVAPLLTGMPGCLIGLLDRKSGALVTRATTTSLAELGVDRLDYLIEWPRDNSVINDVLATHEPVALRQVTPDDLARPAWAQRLHAEALLAVPLVSRGVEAGVIFFYGVPAGYAFSARDVDLAQAFAGVVSHITVNAQLYEDVQVTVAAVLSELRPVSPLKPAPRPRRQGVIRVGDTMLDPGKKQATIGGKPINLTPTEFELLSVLASNSGHVVDQDTLLRRVWGDEYGGRSTVVDVGVHRLRRKIENGAGAPRRIITIRGSGYMLVPGAMLPRTEDGR
jgi:DNA-binding winged helix-turn-helix (wHTH) protein